MVSTITVIVLLITFSNLAAAKSHTNTDETGVPKAQFDAPLAATILSSIFIIALDVVSFFTLLRKLTWTPRRPTGSGFAVPFVAASYFYLGILLLLTGLTLTSNHHWLGGMQETSSWTSTDTNTYDATEVMCFITSGVYCIMFAVVTLLHRTMRTEALGLAEAGMMTSLRAAPAGSSSSVQTAQELSSTGSARPDSALPSEYVDSIAAASRGAGAWGKV